MPYRVFLNRRSRWRSSAYKRSSYSFDMRDQVVLYPHRMAFPGRDAFGVVTRSQRTIADDYCCHLLFDLEPSGVGITLPKLWIAQLPQLHFANSGRYKSEFTNGSTLNRCTKFKCITESKDSRKCTSSRVKSDFSFTHHSA